VQSPLNDVGSVVSRNDDADEWHRVMN
jgi:hypothetical protein